MYWPANFKAWKAWCQQFASKFRVDLEVVILLHKDTKGMYIPLRKSLKKMVFLEIFPKLVDPPLLPLLGTFRNKNVILANFRNKDVNFMAKNNGYQNFT